MFLSPVESVLIDYLSGDLKLKNTLSGNWRGIFFVGYPRYRQT